MFEERILWGQRLPNWADSVLSNSLTWYANPANSDSAGALLSSSSGPRTNGSILREPRPLEVRRLGQGHWLGNDVMFSGLSSE